MQRMPRPLLGQGLVTTLAFSAAILSAGLANAGPKLDLDFDLGTALQNEVDFSWGGGMRLGYRFHGEFVFVQPELGAHYVNFGTNADVVRYDYAGTFTGGLKLGLQGLVQPSIFGHLGLGLLGYDDGHGAVGGHVGPAADLGVGLDLSLLPGFTLGANVAYNVVSVADGGGLATTSARWFTFGLTLGFEFSDEPVRRRRYVMR